MERISSVVVASKHLGNLDEICKTFGKGKETVKAWYANNAPIAFDGKRYSAEYNVLQAWLVDKTKRIK